MDCKSGGHGDGDEDQDDEDNLELMRRIYIDRDMLSAPGWSLVIRH
jgi:hypothetical protein